MLPGQVVAGVGDALGRLDREIQRLDEIRVNEALADYATNVDGLLNDPTDGILAKRGTKAIEGLDGFRDRLSVRRGDVEARLGNARQRDLFRLQSERLVREADRRAVRYLDAETRRVDVENTDRLNANDLRLVVDLAGNEAEVSRILSEMRTRMVLFGDRNGMEREQIADVVAEQAEKARLAQIEALSANDPDRASEALTRAIERGEIRGENVARARKFVETTGLAVRSQAGRDEILTEFGDDEKAALEAVHTRYEGQMEDMVSQRVQAAYADRRRLLTEDTNRLFNGAAQAVMQTGDMGSVNPAHLATLTERNPGLVQRLERLARQTRTGQAAETNWDVWGTLTGMSADQLRSVNPTEYRADLADREYRALDRMVQRARGTGDFARDEPGMSEGQLTTSIFEDAQRLDLLPENVSSWRNLKGDAATRFAQLSDAVQSEMDRRVAAQNGRALSRAEQREAITVVFDDMVMERQGILGRRTVPRAMVLDPERVRELTPEERPYESRFLTLPPAERWEALVNLGVPKDSATAIINRQPR